MPELQVRISDEFGLEIARVDFFWPQFNTVAEADGAIKYEQDAARTARKQLARGKRLRQAGYEIVHFTWAEIVYGSAAVIAEIRAAFARGQG